MADQPSTAETTCGPHAWPACRRRCERRGPL